MTPPNTIKAGQPLPSVQLTAMDDKGRPHGVNIAELVKGKRALIVAVPGAFTPTCSDTHMPGYVRHAEDFRARGIATLICTAVNDVFVLDAWGRKLGADGKNFFMLSDGNGALARALGLELDLTAFGMGRRSSRYAMIVNGGVVEALFNENGAGVDKSAAERVLAFLSP